jgi:hypothetical protein
MTATYKEREITYTIPYELVGTDMLPAYREMMESAAR